MLIGESVTTNLPLLYQLAMLFPSILFPFRSSQFSAKLAVKTPQTFFDGTLPILSPVQK